ncbi:CDIF630_02480 family spore surface protein [Brassicibacter mesophilus]|uniref:CDIF630_02480 family spore surface protein n=1 Tax=Brassicibacter mesophilus TaxID=745119 RepID=UPI003D1BC533
MNKNKLKYKNTKLPIENHQTAAWANITDVKQVSRVPIPSLLEVINAKEWVEENQK